MATLENLKKIESLLHTHAIEVQKINNLVYPLLAKTPNLIDSILQSWFIDGTININRIEKNYKDSLAIQKRLAEIAAEKNALSEEDRKQRMSLETNFARWFVKSKDGDPTGEFLKSFSSEEIKGYIKKMKMNPRLYNELLNYRYNEAVQILERVLSERENKNQMLV